MILYRLEEKGRINLRKIVKENFGDEAHLVLMDVGNHITVFTKDNSEKYVKNIAEEAKLNPREVALYFSGKIRDFILDDEGRVLFSKDQRKSIFNNERNIYILPIELGGVKSLEIYAKTVFDNIMTNVQEKIENNYKGISDEERRRKD